MFIPSFVDKLAITYNIAIILYACFNRMLEDFKLGEISYKHGTQAEFKLPLERFPDPNFSSLICSG